MQMFLRLLLIIKCSKPLLNFHLENIIISKMPLNLNLILFTYLFLLFQLSVSDCPISYYPQSTFVGSIHVDIDSNLNKLKQKQFVYNLIQPLTTNSAKVALMISSLNYHSWGNINFNILYKPSPSFTNLIFLVNVCQQNKSKWDFIQFSFFASQNNLFELGSQYIQNFINTDSENKKSALSKLPLESIYEKPIVKVFLNGLNIQSKTSKQQVDQIKTQIDGYKSLSWSISIINFLQKKLTERESIQCLLANVTLFEKSLSFNIQLGFQQNISFISFSYVIFSSNQNSYRNQFIQGKFALNSNSFINLPSLTHMGQFFIGIQSLTFKQWDLFYSNPSLQMNLNNQTFTIKDTISSNYNSLLFNYFAVSKQKNNYCSHCQDGNIVYQNYCVNQCPQNYAKRANVDAGYYCEFCDIKLFKVTNQDKTQCVCAMQYFPIASAKDSSQFTCSSCNYQCLTCQSQYKCLTCDSNYYNTFRIINQNSQCVCSSGYYDDGQSNIKCLKCHQACLTCKGPSLYDCQICSNGRIKGPNGNCICDKNFTQKNGACVCQNPNFLFKGICYTFLSKSNCSENQLSLTINGTTKCQCKPNYLRYKTICILCGQNQKIDQLTGKCICKQNCYKDDKQGMCIECGMNKTYNQASNRCECIKGLFQTSFGTCIVCRRKQTLINDRCECIYNYFRNDWGQCQRCQRQTNKTQCKINFR